MHLKRNRGIPRRAKGDKQKGWLLLEALVAIVIFSFGMLSVIGLQASSVKHVSEARNRLEASYAADLVAGYLWANKGNLASFATSATGESFTGASFASKFPGLNMPALPNGNLIIAIAGSTATITVEWKMPGETTKRNVVSIAQIG